MIIDDALQNSPDWQAKVEPGAPGIGGPAPDNYFFIQRDDVITFCTQSHAGSDVLWALKRPVLPNTGSLSWQFDINVDAASLAARELEFDVRLAIGGWDHNFSSRINYIKGGMLEISGADGKWIDSGWKPGKLIPGWQTCRYDYWFDTATHLYGIRGITLGDRYFPILPKQQSLLARELKWLDGAYIQVQQDTDTAGGQLSQRMSNMKLIWS